MLAEAEAGNLPEASDHGFGICTSSAITSQLWTALYNTWLHFSIILNLHKRGQGALMHWCLNCIVQHLQYIVPAQERPGCMQLDKVDVVSTLAVHLLHGEKWLIKCKSTIRSANSWRSDAANCHVFSMPSKLEGTHDWCKIARQSQQYCCSCRIIFAKRKSL